MRGKLERHVLGSRAASKAAGDQETTGRIGGIGLQVGELEQTVLEITRRTGIGATLPSAIRTSATAPFSIRASAAIAIFDTACAFRVPIFRACCTYPANFRATQTARINSSAASSIFLYPV